MSNEIIENREKAGLPAGGRPKGSRNKITLLKLLAEESFRTNEIERMQQVCRDIVTDALGGDRDCRKLVWQAMVSKAGAEQQQTAGELPQIVIRTEGVVPPVKRIDVVPAEFTEIEGSNEDEQVKSDPR